MITVYEPKAADFTTLGLGALTPDECVVEEEAGGMFELTLSQPITADGRHRRIVPFGVIKAPAPTRETPMIDLEEISSAPKDIYKVSTVSGKRLYLRAAPSQDAKGIHAYSPGTEVVRLDISDDGNWFRVAILEGGATGWMWAGNLVYVRTEGGSSAVTGILQPRQTREQLFRVYEIEPDSKLRRVTVHAQHISYDLKGAIVLGEYKPQNVPANEVCAMLMSKADHDVSGYNLYCTVKTPVSGDFGGRNIINCLLDEDGVVAQTDAMIVRDNFDIFILPRDTERREVELRYGKNLISAALITNCSGVVTRIRPVGKDKNGEKLYLPENNGFVESDKAADYPLMYAQEIEYDVAVGDDMTENQALEALRSKAANDLAKKQEPTNSIDANFVRLELTEAYRHLANAYALHLYDIVPVIDREAGIGINVSMAKYRYDCLMDRYSDTTLGDVLRVAEYVDPGVATYTAISTGTYSAANASWTYFGDRDIRQGWTPNAGVIFGCMYFGDMSNLAGKTITGVKLRLTRRRGYGRGVAVKTVVVGAKAQYGESSPSLGTSYGSYSAIANGETVSINLNTSVIGDLIDKTIQGLALFVLENSAYEDKDYSANFARFAGMTSGNVDTLPMLTVEYEVEGGIT